MRPETPTPVDRRECFVLMIMVLIVTNNKIQGNRPFHMLPRPKLRSGSKSIVQKPMNISSKRSNTFQEYASKVCFFYTLTSGI